METRISHSMIKAVSGEFDLESVIKLSLCRMSNDLSSFLLSEIVFKIPRCRYQKNRKFRRVRKSSRAESNRYIKTNVTPTLPCLEEYSNLMLSCKAMKSKKYLD